MKELSSDFDVDTPIDHNFHVDQNGEKLKRWEASLSQEYWDYRNEWQDRPEKRIVGNFPIHLDIEATSECNLLCTMCPRTDLINEDSFWKVENFDFELYKKIISEGVSKGLRSIKFNYLGEPLLNKKLIDMIKYAKQAGIIDVMFNTNATALTEKNSKKLIESGLDKIFFSFDSPRREQYNRIRVGADYDKVLNNIKQFVKIRDELGSVLPFTRVSMVLMKETENEWPIFKKLFEPIVDVVAYVDYLDHGNQSTEDKTVVDLGVRKTKFCCPQLWQRMFIHPDGIATVCCIDSSRELTVGNAWTQTVQEIWHSSEYERLRNLHASGRYNEIPVCATCPLAKY